MIVHHVRQPADRPTLRRLLAAFQPDLLHVHYWGAVDTAWYEAVVEAAEAVHWAAPGDLEFSPKVSPKKQLGNHYGRGTLVVMYDGSQAFLSLKASEVSLRSAIDPDDGKAIGEDLFAVEAPGGGDLRRTIATLLRLRSARQSTPPQKQR